MKNYITLENPSTKDKITLVSRTKDINIREECGYTKVVSISNSCPLNHDSISVLKSLSNSVVLHLEDFNTNAGATIGTYRTKR